MTVNPGGRAQEGQVASGLPSPVGWVLAVRNFGKKRSGLGFKEMKEEAARAS